MKDPIPNILRLGAVYRIPCDEELRDAVYITAAERARGENRSRSQESEFSGEQFLVIDCCIFLHGAFFWKASHTNT